MHSTFPGHQGFDDDLYPPQESFLAKRPKLLSFIPAMMLAGCIAMVSVMAWMEPGWGRSMAGNLTQVTDEGEYYRLFSSMLIHKDVLHLLNNLVFLIPFGGLLTAYYGYSVFPFLALISTAITHYVALLTYSAQTYLIGASGLVYVLFGLWISLMFHVEAHLPWTRRMLRITGFSLIMVIPATVTPSVSYRTHFIGLLSGLACGAIYGLIARKSFEKRNVLHNAELVALPDRNESPTSG